MRYAASTVKTSKMYYSISEVSEMTGVKPHVLRYWETEFPSLKPKKNRAGNRNYRQKDIKAILVIRDLLYKEKFTISGARKKLQEHYGNPDELMNQLQIPFSASYAFPSNQHQTAQLFDPVSVACGPDNSRAAWKPLQ